MMKYSKQILPIDYQDIELIDDKKLEEFLVTNQVVNDMVETVANETKTIN